MSKRCPRCQVVYGDEARFCSADGTRLVAAVGGGAGPAVPVAGNVNFARLVGQVLDGRYRVTQKIGEGGMSFVYEATDIPTGTKHAIKMLSPKLVKDVNAMERLRREASFGVRLAHPNVCHIERLGETDTGLAFIVMPYIEGELLCDRTNRLGFLRLHDAIRFVRDIATGLRLAHSLGIIHRDLKPENVMIAPGADGAEKAVVMDFGLAKERHVSAAVKKLTATGIVVGTPEFMSPEQLRGKPLDSRTDIYSLGVMTYEMLTSRLPFAGNSQQDIMLARLKGDPVPIREMRPELNFSPRVERALQKCMARDAAARYGSALEFVAELSAAAGPEPA